MNPVIRHHDLPIHFVMSHVDQGPRLNGYRLRPETLGNGPDRSPRFPGDGRRTVGFGSEQRQCASCEYAENPEDMAGECAGRRA
jgi:hypothetical protein